MSDITGSRFRAAPWLPGNNHAQAPCQVQELGRTASITSHCDANLEKMSYPVTLQFDNHVLPRSSQACTASHGPQRAFSLSRSQRDSAITNDADPTPLSPAGFESLGVLLLPHAISPRIDVEPKGCSRDRPWIGGSEEANHQRIAPDASDGLSLGE